MMTQNARSLRPVLRAARILWMVAAITLFAGCASTSQLRTAQDKFSQAARLENQALLSSSDLALHDPAAPGPAATLVDGALAKAQAEALYRESLAILKSADSNKALQAQLDQDKLPGSWLTLQALSHWRLREYDQASDKAGLARIHLDEQLYPRDKALLVALPGLIKNDEAAAKIATLPPGQGSFDTVKKLLDSALRDLGEARQKADSGHPIQVYLIQSQLAAGKNLQVMFSKLHPTSRSVPAEVQQDIKARILELRDLVGGTPEGSKLLTYWTVQTGVRL